MIISRAWYSLGCHEWGIVQRFFQEKEETCLLNQSKNRFLWLVRHYEITICEKGCAAADSGLFLLLSGIPLLYQTSVSRMRTNSSSPALSSSVKRPTYGLSRSRTPITCPPAWIGITISEFDALSQAMWPGNW